jgi:hypothetical protein
MPAKIAAGEGPPVGLALVSELIVVVPLTATPV